MCTLFHHLKAFLARAIVTFAARVISVTLALAYHLLTAPWRAPVGSAILATFIVIMTNNSLIHYHHIVAVVLHICIVLATGRYYDRQHHNHHNHNLLHNLNFLNCYTLCFYFWCKDTAIYWITKMIIPKLVGVFPKPKGDISPLNNKKYLIVLAYSKKRCNFALCISYIRNTSV